MVPNRNLRKVSGVAALFPCLSVNVYKMGICFFTNLEKGLRSKEKNVVGVKRKQKRSTEMQALEGRKKIHTIE